MLKLIPKAKVSAQFLYFDFNNMGGWVEKAHEGQISDTDSKP